MKMVADLPSSEFGFFISLDLACDVRLRKVRLWTELCESKCKNAYHFYLSANVRKVCASLLLWNLTIAKRDWGFG